MLLNQRWKINHTAFVLSLFDTGLGAVRSLGKGDSLKISKGLHILLHILGTPIRRWHNETDEMYILDMPLIPREERNDIRVIKKTEWDSKIEAFARQRQEEDPTWQDQDYVSEVRQRLKEGNWCYLAEYQGRNAGVVYAVKDSYFIRPVRYRLHFPAKIVGLYDVYTTPACRGQGLFSPIFNTAVNDCWRQGFEIAWLWIMPHNRYSFVVHNRLGMSHIFRRILHRQRWSLRWHQIEDLNLSVDELLPQLAQRTDI